MHRPVDLPLVRRIVVGIAMCSATAFGNTYVNRAYGYTVEYPSNWYPQIAENVFYVESFPPSDSIRAVGLPNGGAGMKILVPAQTVRSGQTVPRSLEEWIVLDTAGDAVIGRRSFELERSGTAFRIIDVTIRCCTVLESHLWYFRLADRMFVAIVTYWEGDPGAEQWMNALKDLVLSLRLSEP